MQKLLEKLENLEDELLSNMAFINVSYFKGQIKVKILTKHNTTILCDTEEECNAVIERLKSEYRDLLILDERGIIS